MTFSVVLAVQGDLAAPGEAAHLQTLRDPQGGVHKRMGNCAAVSPEVHRQWRSGYADARITLSRYGFLRPGASAGPARVKQGVLMRLTDYTDYALRVMLYLALRRDGLSTIQDISDAY
ncbi:MAG TPA: hypothetical protein VNZ04_00375, partial [Trinickia sp.]|nr:hypothetical protein [Trinickia sp.]